MLGNRVGEKKISNLFILLNSWKACKTKQHTCAVKLLIIFLVINLSFVDMLVLPDKQKMLTVCSGSL